MATGIAYPAALPAWLVNGHVRQLLPVAERVSMEYGPARMRRQFRSAPHIVDVSTILVPSKFNVFYDFHEQDIQAGALSFNVRLAGPSFANGIEWWEARFVAPWKAVYKLDGALWIITAQLRLLNGPYATQPGGPPLAAEATAVGVIDASLSVGNSLAAEATATVTADAKLDPIAQHLAAEATASGTVDANLSDHGASILLESGSYLLTETSDNILLE